LLFLLLFLFIKNNYILILIKLNMWKKKYYTIQWKNDNGLYRILNKENLDFIELDFDGIKNFIKDKYIHLDLDDELIGIDEKDEIKKIINKKNKR